MKKPSSVLTGLGLTLLLATFNAQFSTCRAATTINTVNHYAYAANVGWVDARGDVSNGVVIGEYVCSGYLYAANVGWINLGGGAPANGIQYQNNSATDYGVNQDGLGNLRGYAYGANIGWINFESNGAPRVDLKSGRLSGFIYSANCGWISLSNAVAFVQTDTITAGADTDGDGIADAWERLKFGNLTTANAVSDFDHDGVLDKDEYLADTNPNDPNDYLRMVSITHGNPTSTYTVLTWTAQPTRCYAVQERPTLDSGSAWLDFFVTPFLGANNVVFDETTSQHFYRVRAFRPLAP